ncbi:neutral zinc metallopeptidase [Amycolatopsis alkalitolerans]|uniref:Metalloprotease n=1 Tax=Amycolatopsis alkalitolerans TaxID=2547244 RepID=A0A5C4LZ05_9PSEU|nr:neutral zinc metallopeptidase [Amycolatopsis alkalitolerans]TNC23233.1 metalloprotease [Amycolatopsis alkalitolerans]
MAFTLSAVAVLLAGLVVFVVVNRFGGDGGPNGASGSVAVPTSANGNAGAGAGGSRAVPGEKILELADHPILQNPDAGLPNIVCRLPPWQRDQASVEAFFRAAVLCLNQAWGPFLQAYHLPFAPPVLHFPNGTSFVTACGTIAVGVATAAYYCDDNLYVPYRGLQIDQYGDNPGVYLALIAHEYGHHVQEVAGIMDAVWQRIYQVGQNTPAGLDLSRRKELQAQCFSGMFLGAVVDRGGSVTRAMYEKAWRDQDTRGDNTSGSHDHGTNAHYAQWWRTGAQYNRIAKCNTFAAPASEVS